MFVQKKVLLQETFLALRKYAARKGSAEYVCASFVRFFQLYDLALIGS